MNIIKKIKKQAKKLKKYIIFPESTEKRTLQAIKIITKQKIAIPILIGTKEEIKKEAEKYKIKLNYNKIKFLNPNETKLKERYENELYKLRKDKGLTKEKAKQLLKDNNYIGVMAVKLGEADGMISGAVGSTADTVRPALQIIKTKEKFHKVSGLLFLIFKKKLLIFADCAINIEPNSHDLADIAIDTAKTAIRFGIKPRIAMLSFSTYGSAKHPQVDKVKEAVKLAQDKAPNLIIDGEMQVDSALIKKVRQKKAKNSILKKNANILIFPDLQSANIAYKLVERLAKAKAIGPILQGLQKPINDLSRGCSAKDIVNITAFTSCEAEEINYKL